MNRLPAKEGVTHKVLDPQDGIPYHVARLSAATALKDMEAEYAFFTTALLFTHGEWTRDPVEDYLTKHPTAYPFHINLPRPVFKGLEVGASLDWNYRIMACLKTDWEGDDGLCGFLMSLGGIDRHKRRYHRMLVQKITIPDVFSLERATILPVPLPTVDVITFGVDGSNWRVGFEPASDPPCNQATVVKLRPDPEVVRLASAVLSGHPSPFRVVQPPPAEELDRFVSEVKRLRESGGKPGIALREKQILQTGGFES
jgi:hypothetical protein